MQDNKTTNITHDDEINLGELFIKLWGQKWIVTISVSLCLILSIIYAQTRPVAYEVKAVVTTPGNDQLLDINLNGLTKYTPESIFKLYFKELKSPALLRDYFEDKKMHSIEDNVNKESKTQNEIDAAFLSFLKQMKVINSTPEFLQKTVEGKIVKGSDASLLQADITLITADSQITAEFINGYIEFVNEQLLEKMQKEQLARKQQQLSELKRIQDLVLSVEKKQRELSILKMKENQSIQVVKIEAEIKSTINVYFENLEAQIVQLKASLSIAQQLNIVEPKSLADFYSDSSLAGKIEIYTSENKGNNDYMLADKGYLLGIKFLMAEITELEKRRKNSRFVEGLAELNQKLLIAKNNPELTALQNRADDKPYVAAYLNTLDKVEKLEQVNLKFNNPKFYQLTQEAIAPGNLVGRSKNIYLALGIVLGGMLGLMLALIRIAIANYREKH
ncbi:MAG: hypothetical protein HRU38_09140 [Saccharospirillaceae bacterium]|nr:Wzz/FepE/Etk N-terminal domain-containing protein [Pseudomonadales bacterium]NRB78819.1 hypothetical protein [Saccharospirillaceae bacterium]